MRLNIALGWFVFHYRQRNPSREPSLAPGLSDVGDDAFTLLATWVSTY
jgi:hypothetical protein